jgi:beta-ureidopropionase / N-carbamoyl-L-amino-acid hydrolase
VRPTPGATQSLGVDAERLWEEIMALGAITEPDRPYTRRSFSPLFGEGRAWLTQRMREAGLNTHIDAAGNLIGRRDGKEPSSRAIVVGSHSDSVPSGGRFDGMAGVIGGIAIARALDEHGLSLVHPLEIIDFLAEEPNEFGLSCIGSRGITGCLSGEHLALRNPQNETLEAALVRVGGDPARLKAARRGDIKGAFELHIEQGPVLEAEGIDIGVVTAIVGITRQEIEFQGTAGHAGTTPMPGRRDPLIAAARLVGWVRACALDLASRGQGHFVATVGIIEALPGGSNVIPKTARIVIDARCEDRRLIEEFRGALDAESRAAARAANVERSKFNCLSDNLPAACDPHLQDVLGRSATLLGLSSRAMASGAGHDMAFISQVAPAAMVFIPCKGGRSHTPEEWASAEALAAGTHVILEAILRIDAEPATASSELPNTQDGAS